MALNSKNSKEEEKKMEESKIIDVKRQAANKTAGSVYTSESGFKSRRNSLEVDEDQDEDRFTHQENEADEQEYAGNDDESLSDIKRLSKADTKQEYMFWDRDR